MNSKQHLIHIEWSLALAVVSLGITTIITQIILLREFLSVFYGNELVIGIVLGNWMILAGAGSIVGRLSVRIDDKIRCIGITLIILAILPPLTIFMLRFFRNIVFEVGSMVSVLEILYTTFLLMLPFCLLSGFSFTLLSDTLSTKYKSNFIAIVYTFEPLGSLIGGFVFSFFLIYFFSRHSKVFSCLWCSMEWWYSFF